MRRPSLLYLAGAASLVVLSLLAQPAAAVRSAPPPPAAGTGTGTGSSPEATPAVLAQGVPQPQVADKPPAATVAGTFSASIRIWDTSAAAVRMEQSQAMHDMLGAGLGWKSTGHCVNADRRMCTSLQAIRYGTLMQTINLKLASGCPITVTGGTEKGHAGGHFSHRNGFKIDVAHNPCIDAYITRTFPFWKVRGDGAHLYRPFLIPGLTGDPDIYADEPTHWDILYR